MNFIHKSLSVDIGLPETPVQSEYLSWGRYPRVHHSMVHKIHWMDEITAALTQNGTSYLPYGLGRSYGDSCLNDGGGLLDCSRLDRILDFDVAAGRIRCEAGVSLADVLHVAVPRGWFLPVTPGTKFVSVAGAIANDVHGKNHHRGGTFGAHVRSFLLFRSDQQPRVCVPGDPLFAATIGGLGMTGVIGWAEFQLKPIVGPFIQHETVPFSSLPQFLDLCNASDQQFEYTVAWIDSFAGKGTRGIFLRGNHSDRGGPAVLRRFAPTVPAAFPAFVLNPLMIKAFNSAYYALRRWSAHASIVHYDPFFFPLDSVLRWNLIYGARGFLQYQCVVPETHADSLEQILHMTSAARQGSFLAVLKRFGSTPSPGMISFPRPGLTLALDFPMRGNATLRLLDRLDEVVQASGGAVYPAKDARMGTRMFEASFPQWRAFAAYVDPKCSSSFWRRVTGAVS